MSRYHDLQQLKRQGQAEATERGCVLVIVDVFGDYLLRSPGRAASIIASHPAAEIVGDPIRPEALFTEEGK